MSGRSFICPAHVRFDPNQTLSAHLRLTDSGRKRPVRYQATGAGKWKCSEVRHVWRMRPFLATAARSSSAAQTRRMVPWKRRDCAGATISAERCWFRRLPGVWGPTLLIGGAYIARLFLCSGHNAVAGCRKYRGERQSPNSRGLPAGLTIGAALHAAAGVAVALVILISCLACWRRHPLGC